MKTVEKKELLISENERKALNATIQFCLEKEVTASSPPGEWPTTREIAQYCSFDIYKTRYCLLNLVKFGMIFTHSTLVKNSLRWRALGEYIKPPPQSLE